MIPARCKKTICKKIFYLKISIRPSRKEGPGGTRGQEIQDIEGCLFLLGINIKFVNTIADVGKYCEWQTHAINCPLL
jgi:hypothetical protein